MSDLLTLIADGGVGASCPRTLRDQSHARWFESGPPSELLPILNEVIGRLGASVKLPEGPALMEGSIVDPQYVAASVEGDGRTEFVDHLAEAGLVKDDGYTHLGVFTRESSWFTAADNVLLESAVVAREAPSGEWFEPDPEEGAIRAFLPLSTSVKSILSHCCDHPCDLMGRIELGIMAYWVTKFGGDPRELDFEFGPDFFDSIVRMNYPRNARYAASCLRVMARIAGGRGHEVDGHEERDGSQGSKPVRKDVDGNPVMRAYLAQQTSDANRLFWVRGQRPRFLNVSGHEGGPTAIDG